MAEALSAQSLLEAAAIAAAKGNPHDAERALRQALTVQEGELGRDHGDLAATLNNLAVVCEWLEKPADAERFYRRALAVATAAFAPGHPEIATTRRNLDDFCRARGLSPTVSSARIGGTEDSSPDAAQGHAAPPATPAAPTPTGKAIPDTAGRPTESAFDSDRSDATSHATAQRTGGRTLWWWMPRGAIAVAAVAVIAVFANNLLRGSSTRAVATTSPAARETRTLSGVPADVEGSGPLVAAAVPADAETQLGADVPEQPRTSVSDRASGEALRTPERDSSTIDQPRGDASSVTVVAARLCRDLSRGPGPWTCNEPAGPVEAGSLYFYTRIASPSGADIQHQWYQGDRLVQSVPLRVAASATEGYRTFSRQTVSAESGPWRVELRSGEVLLREERFVVR